MMLSRPLVLATAIALLLSLCTCARVCAQSAHPDAWQTGVDIAGFEGDVYSTLNLSGEQAKQFGTFFSSALYGLAVGDAYVQYSEGDGAGAMSTLSRASLEFAVGLSPWGAAYAGLKLITWAPPAYVDCLVDFNTGQGFKAYQRLRTEPGGPWGLPTEPIEFTSERYRMWRAQARNAFEQVWGDIEAGRDFGAYCRSARKAILEQRLAKWGWWESWFTTEDNKEKARVITLEEIKAWTFANWEARVVVDVLSNYVPRRLDAARRQMLVTSVEVVFRVADYGGAPLDLERLNFTANIPGLTTFARGERVKLSLFMGDLPKLQGYARLDFIAIEAGSGRQSRGSLEVGEILNHSRWERLVELGEPLIRIDLGTVRVDAATRDVEVQLRGTGVRDARIEVGGRSFTPEAGATGGTWQAELAPGTYLAQATGRGPEGQPVRRVAVVRVSPRAESGPAPVVLALDAGGVPAQAGSIEAIRSAISANATKLRANAISPEEYNYAVSASVAKAEGTVRQADGTEVAVVRLARDEANKTAEQLRREGQSDLARRAQDLLADIRAIPERLPEEHRATLTSASNLQGFVRRTMQGARPRNDRFPIGPTRAIELTISHATRQRDLLRDLLGPALAALDAEVTSAAAKADDLLAEYERRWALVSFSDGQVEGTLRTLTFSTLAQYQRVVEAGEELKREHPADELDRLVAELKEALSRRQDEVARAREKHLQLRGELDSLRTVTLTDAARVAAALAAVDNVRTMVSYLNTADVHRRAIQDPDRADERAGNARRFAEAVGTVLGTMRDGTVEAALVSVDIGATPGADEGLAVTQAASVAYRLGAAQQRVRKALWLEGRLRREYGAFYNQSLELLEDPLVNEAALRVPEGDPEPTPQGAWFSPGRRIPAAELGEHAPYDLAAIAELTRSISMNDGRCGLTRGDLTGIAGALLLALEEDEAEFQALNADLRETLRAYEQAAGKVGAGHRELSEALNAGPAARQEFGAAIARATQEGRAPFHLAKTSAETEQALKDADAGYLALVREHYSRAVAAIGAVAKRVEALAADVRRGWASAESVERYLWEEGFQELLTEASDLGPHGTGHPDLHRHSAGALAWMVPGVRQAMDEGDNALVAARDRLNTTCEATQATHREVFSNRARLTRTVPPGAPGPAMAPAPPRMATTRKVAGANPAIGKIAWTPDGTKLAWHSQPASIHMVSAAGGELIPLPNTGGWFGGTGTSPAFSPNGLLLVHEGPWGGGLRSTETMQGVTRSFTTDRTMEFVFRRADGSGLQRLVGLNATKVGLSAVTRFQVAPDGRLFVGWRDGERSGYGWLDPDTGELTKTEVPGGTADADLSADGEWVVYTVQGTKRLMLAPAAGGAARDLGTVARDPALSPQGKWVAYCYGDRVMVMPTGGGEPRELIRSEGVSLLSWSPRGDAIAYRRFAEGDVGLWVARLR